MKKPTLILALAALLAVLAPASEASADKIRDLADIKGARDNQLIGYGVVTGLAGTGDDTSAPLATQSMMAMLRRLGVQVDSKQLRLKNIAAVVVTATIPPFAKSGTELDVTVSSIGNASSLAGGVLVQTVLKGANRKSYAVAQGSLVLGGFAAKGKSGSAVKSGSQTVGRIPQGALVEREIPTKFVFNGKLHLSLRQPSFTLASAVANAIDGALGEGSASAADGGSVTITVPEDLLARPVDLIAQIEQIDVQAERRATVVVNERTQTIVAGGDVRLSPVAIVHGDLTIIVKEQKVVSQPDPLSEGKTVESKESDVAVEEKESTMQYLDGAQTLADLSSVLGTLGLNARELISVLQALRTAGALEADLVVQ